LPSPSPKRQIVWIARHGNRLDFVDPDWFSTAERPYDPPLSADGIVQARELAQRLQQENIAHIFASPFLRTVQTAFEVAQVLDLPIKLEAGLSEWLNPDWMTHQPQRLSIEALAQQYPRIDRRYQSRFVPQYPESEAQVMSRTATLAQQLVSEFTEDILLIGHGASVVGATQGLLRDRVEMRATLCCLVKLQRAENAAWTLELNADTSHLSQPQQPIRWH
jgi:broad specificity phosphatase PhoE